MPQYSSNFIPSPIIQTRIVNGSPSLSHEFSFLVRITEHNAFLLCGGSILSTMLVVTAAHCVVGKIPLNLAIVAGDHDRKRRESSEQYRTISSIFIHPKYNKTISEKSNEHDIALLILSKPLKFSKFVRPIKIPNPKYVPQASNNEGYAILAGWGQTDPMYPSFSDTVRKAVVKVVPWDECSKRYNKEKLIVTPKTMLCAGTNGVDSCGGDSGGPLICPVNASHIRNSDYSDFLLCGIVSFGGKYCGEKNVPGVYTAVAEYTSWILKTLSNYEKWGKCTPSELYCPGNDDPETPHICISRSLICNGHLDCPGGEDELHCECFSSSDQDPHSFKCSNGYTVDQDWVCDGVDDCGDSSEENKCSRAPCPPDQFTCHRDNRCIPSVWYCDGINDCTDRSDEEEECNSTSTKPGIAVNPLELRNEYQYTKSNSTTAALVCGESQFLCERSNVCIPVEEVCDCEEYCFYGEDEENCSVRWLRVAQ